MQANGKDVDIDGAQQRWKSRSETIKQLLEDTAAGMRHCHDFLVAANSNLQAQHAAVSRRQSKTAALVQLLSDKLTTLKQLPEAEKKARSLLRTLRKTERHASRTWVILCTAPWRARWLTAIG